jgi:hypothetical protein
MPEWTLQKCKLLSSTFVPDRSSETERVDFRGLFARLGVDLPEEFKAKALAARSGSFIGQIRTSRGVVNFVLINPDMTGSFEWLDRKDPTFSDRVVKVYRVEQFSREGAIEEMASERRG